jgi:uncharacterized protein YbaR (Trm112 family)/SAM-dependent methyltransferase
MSYLKYFQRNFKVNIKRGRKVIDIGPGHAPLIRADVLCDMYPLESSQRAVTSMYFPPGRFVVADFHDLPFKDKSFDFAYSRAVLEHLSDPIKACTEMSRIASAGLIVTPSRLWEIMGGAASHLWLISVKNNKLICKRKTVDDMSLNSLIPEKIRNSGKYEELFHFFYEDFFIEHYWENKIEMEIVYDEGVGIYNFVEDKKIEMTNQNLYQQILGSNGIWRKGKILMFEALRRFMGGQNIHLSSIIACPQCKKGFSEKYSSRLICERCNVEYPIMHGIPILLKEKAIVLDSN